MTKKLLGSGIVIAMMLTSALSAFSATAASDSLMFGDFEYTPRNTYAEINAYKGTDTTVEIPAEINGLKVRQIATNGLCGNKYVEKYILPEGITTVGQHALCQNTNLKEIVFPSTLKSVQFGAISYDSALEVVNFPEGLETIEGCVLYTCYGLTDVYIPSTVTSIGENMFCSSSYGLEEFHVDEKNESYCSVNGVIFTKDMTRLVRYPLNKAETEYDIPTTVAEIAPSAFDTVTVLEKLEIPDNVKTIGERAFSMATLNELRLPHDLTVLPQYCIGSMRKLEKLYIPKSLTTMGNVACTFFDVMPTIYYEGTEEDWKSIEIGSMNADFSSLEFVYNYDYSTDISETLMGDVNNDGAFNVSDVVLLQKWLLAVPDTHLANWKAADFCEDNALNVFDLCLMKRALIEQRISEGQPVLYCEGEKIGESDEKGWYSTEYSDGITDKQLSEHPEILEQLNKVIAKADKLAVTNMLEYNDWGIADYGEDCLYLPYGDNDRILLCKFGSDCGWLGDSDVQKLVKLLVENGFFSDKSLFSDFTEFLSSKHPATKMSIVPVGYSSGISEQSDKWSDAITSTAELADYTKLLYDSYYDTMQHNMEAFSANYNDEFFAENVLLLKPIYLTDSSPEYTIDMVTYKDNKLIVDYTERISGEGCDVLGGLLGVVVVPKENYHGESIEWKLTTYDWNGIKSGYLAVFSGEDDAGTIHNTYVYKTDNGSENYGFDFTNTTLNPKTLQETIIKQGYVTWTDSVFTEAEKNGAYDYVKLPGDSTHYSIDEFREMFIMN